MNDKSWNLASWELQMRNRFGKRFTGRAAASQPRPEPKDTPNADRLREDMERKLSRIADASWSAGIPGEPDAA